VRRRRGCSSSPQPPTRPPEADARSCKFLVGFEVEKAAPLVPVENCAAPLSSHRPSTEPLRSKQCLHAYTCVAKVSPLHTSIHTTSDAHCSLTLIMRRKCIC
jgi:hypothetical protein